MTNPPRDAMLQMLASLSASAPTARHDARVRARCHAALRSRPAIERLPWATAAARAADRLLPVAVLVYAIVTVAEAIRTGWLAGG